MKPLLAALVLASIAFSALPARAASEAALFRAADSNGNGTLNRAEFRSFIQALARDGNAIAKRVRFFGVYGMAFRMTDADRNGELTGAELQRSARDNADKVR